MNSSTDYRAYYQEKLEQGLQFQDHVTDVLYEQGMVVVTYVSKARGLKAENKLGVEIKRDAKFRETGNLFIEVAEKSHPSNPLFVSSGIYRKDNSWLYAIGDEQTLWIFSKKILVLLIEAKPPRYQRREIPTSRGYLLPLSDGDKYALKRIDTVVR